MRPDSEAELAEMIAAAEAPLRIGGGGTRDVGRAIAGDMLETGGLSGILGWATYAGLSALAGLVLGVVIALLVHNVFKLGQTHAEH